MRGADAAGTVHDLANVLSVVSATVAMLADDLAELDAGHPARESVERLALAACRAGELCERLRTPLPRRVHGAHDLAGAVREGVDLLGGALKGTELVLRADGPLSVRGPALETLQVLLNLVSNASEAAPGTPIAVVADAWVADRTPPTVGRLVPGRRYARLVVEDRGPGIEPATAGDLFQPGATGSGDPRRGRGLAVVAEIVERARGAVRVERSDAGGTRFSVLWPLLEAAHGGLADRSVLIVGGAPDTVARLADAAEAAGAEVSLCLEPDDAVASVAEDVGAWDGVVVAGGARGSSAAAIATRLRDADPTLALLRMGTDGGVTEVIAALKRRFASPGTPGEREGAA